MSVKLIYFVHGTTTDNIEHIATGWNHGELSEKGKSQLLELKQQIDFSAIDLVISSDLKRAIDSANFLFKGIKEILNDDRIRECNYGDFNGKANLLVKYEDYIDNVFPNGECLKDVEKRVRDFCEYLLENFNGKTIAIVAHKASQLALDVITKNISWKEAIDKDWRKTGNWQPGWKYEINGLIKMKDIERQ